MTSIFRGHLYSVNSQGCRGELTEVQRYELTGVQRGAQGCRVVVS